MKNSSLFIILLSLFLAGCNRKQARLLFSESSPDHKKKVEVWWHPESDFEYQSDMIWVLLTDVSDPTNFMGRELFPDKINSAQYQNMMKKNPSVTITWGSGPFEAKVVDAESQFVLIEHPKKKTEQ